MAYLIHDIRAFPVEDYPYYYCDANVWIAALKYYSNESENNYETPYQTFINAIVNLNEVHDPKIEKRIKNKPKIVVSSIVFSEIINAYMRNVAMRAYFGGGEEYQRFNYKKEYRDDPSTDYKSQLNNLCTDIASFSDYTILYNDEFEELNPFSIIPELPLLDSDFNDIYYYHSLKDKDIPFVTHDKDFKFPDIMIITANQLLLKISSI